VTSAHLLVRVGGERYALPIHDVVEVTRMGDLIPVPGAPHALLGVQNVRGQVVPVVDLGAVVGMPRSETRGAVVVVDDSGQPAGLAVDALLDVAELVAEGSESPDGPLLGSAMVDGALVGLLDTRRSLRLAQGSA
jgi:purine-binding chemotaxis protein CheW